MFWKPKLTPRVRRNHKKRHNMPLGLNTHLMNDIGLERWQEIPLVPIWPRGW